MRMVFDRATPKEYKGKINNHFHKDTVCDFL
jgi:hypothetical protein